MYEENIMEYILCFLGGLFIGVCGLLLALALCTAASEADEIARKEYENWRTLN